jgi:PAS domain S-box-containing protein
VTSVKQSSGSGRAPRSIQSWLITLVAVALVPVLAFTLITALSLVERERSTLASGLQNTARALALAVDQELEASIATLQGLAGSTKLASADYPGFYRQLEQARADPRRSWWTAGVVDRTGHQVVSLDPPVNGVAGAVLGRDDFWASIQADRFWISDRLLKPDSEEALVLVAVPLPWPRAGHQGTLMAVVKAQAMSASVARHRLPPGVSANVLDRGQTTVVRIPTVTTGAARELAGSLPPYSAEGFGHFPKEGGEAVYAAFARAPLSGWTVTLVVPESAFEAPWRRWLWTMGGGGVFLLLMGLGLAALAARRIARPVAALSVRAQALGRGEAWPPTQSGIAEVDEVERAIVAAGAARRDAEEAVRESEARLHTTLRDIGDAVLSTDADGSVRFMNKAAESLIGWRLDEVQGRPLDNVAVFLNEASRERVDNPVTRMLRDGLEGNLADHTILLSRHGQEIAIDERAAPIRDDAGRLLGVVLVLRDVTARRNFEDALRSSESRYRAIIEDQTELVCRLTPEGTLTFVNGAYAQYLGRSAEDLVGGHPLLMVDPEDRERVAQALESLGPDRPMVTIENRGLDGAGELRWTQWIVRALADLDGCVVEIQAVGRDITDRKRTEQALAQSATDLESRARQQAAVALLGQRALAGADLDTLLREAVELLCATLGAEFCKVLELAAEGSQLVTRASVGWPCGAKPLTFVASEGSQVELVLRTREPVVIPDFGAETRFFDSAVFRERGIVSGMSVVIHGGARPYGLLGVHTTKRRAFTRDDVNFLQSIANVLAAAVARARAEGERAELLARAQEARVAAEKANQAKDEFLAMLSHELRNPLAAITNASRLLEQGGSAGEQTVHLGSIVARQSEHLSRMVDDLLDVSRLNSGKIVLRRELVDMKHVVERSVAAVTQAGRTTRHELHVDAESVLVSGDATRLEQVVRNLLDNALKYTPPGGQIELTVERDGDVMSMRVRDTGVGIAPEILPHIFELFVQAHRSLDRADGGLGLGLTLVRRLVQMHGGTVSASSDGSAQGSEFEVRIPVAETTASAGLVSPSPAAQTSRRVLVVEDNPDARETLVLLLESWGHSVAQAADGEAAVVLAAGEALDVALIDVGLPRMDGYAVARAVRAIPACAQLRLVALTGYSREEDRRLAKAAGFDAYLVKPVDPDALKDVLSGPLSS